MVLVFAEQQKGKFKKATLEAITYGAKTAQLLNTTCGALVLGAAEGVENLGVYGATKIYQVADSGLNHFDSQTYATVISDAAKSLGATVVIMGHSSTGKSLLGRIAIRLDAGSVAGANQLPTVDGSFKVNKNVFSGKAIATYEVSSDVNRGRVGSIRRKGNEGAWKLGNH